MRNFIRSLDKTKVGKIVNFGSAAMLNSTYKKVKAEADAVGISMDEREFHCLGEFKGIHKGRPNADDLRAAAEFAPSDRKPRLTNAKPMPIIRWCGNSPHHLII